MANKRSFSADGQVGYRRIQSLRGQIVQHSFPIESEAQTVYHLGTEHISFLSRYGTTGGPIISAGLPA
jgi:hypothetical protein